MSGERPPNRSDAVQRAIDAGYSPAGPFAVSWFGYEARPGRGDHHQLNVLAGDVKVEVSVSPTGRSVRVWVDGEEVER
jgi:hypothetical protein